MTREQQILADRRHDQGYSHAIKEEPNEQNVTISDSKLAPKSEDRDLLESVLSVCLAYKVAFPHASEDQQVEFLQSGYQALMESLSEAGIVMNPTKFAATTAGIINILQEHQE